MSTAVKNPKPQVLEESGKTKSSAGIFNREAVLRALPLTFAKLHPKVMFAHPVMFVVEIGAVLVSLVGVVQLFGPLFGTAQDQQPSPLFTWGIAFWLWLTVLFANFAEALAEGRGQAQADSLRATRTSTPAFKITRYDPQGDPSGSFAESSGGLEEVSSAVLAPGDVVLVRSPGVIPGDGEVIWGVASIDESAITGESAPVVREAGGDRSAVTGGTRILSDRLVMRVTSKPGETFVDKMIALVEGSSRQKTPNEVALNVLLASLSFVFVLVTLTLGPIASAVGASVPLPVLVALLVCLIPTTIGALLSAIGIAGMDRLVQHNVLAVSGRAVEAAGDVTTLLLDKTGTITYGNRQAADMITVGETHQEDLVRAAVLSSLSDPTPEGQSVLVLAEGWGMRAEALERTHAVGGQFVAFSAQTRMSGVDQADGVQIRKGASSAILEWISEEGPEQDTADPASTDARAKEDMIRVVREISEAGGTPLVVARKVPYQGGFRGELLGVLYLKDVVKQGLRERFEQLRAMGIRTVMVTGDNPLTARAIAEEAGVDDFLAEATPEQKLELIRKEQEGGNLVAMSGDGTNDAPALAQADVGVAMNTGTAAAKEAGNMVDLDSDPTKLISVVRIGKQLLMTRGALTTFSIANDVAKYFAIIPAMFLLAFPQLEALNVMGLSSPTSAVLSAVIFNGVVIVFLIPLALKGVSYGGGSSSRMLARNLLIFGVGGVIAPFVGIKLIDLLISLIPGL